MVSLSKTLNGYGVFSDGEDVGVIEYKDFWDGMPYLSPVSYTHLTLPTNCT